MMMQALHGIPCAPLSNLRHGVLTLFHPQVVEQATLQPLAELGRPAVILVAARFGSVRLLDNMEI